MTQAQKLKSFHERKGNPVCLLICEAVRYCNECGVDENTHTYIYIFSDNSILLINSNQISTQLGN